MRPTQKTTFTMEKIANELNLSRTAISYALSQDWEEHRISKETRQRVVDFANQVGYRRNKIAVGLRTKKTKIIGTLLHILGYEEHELLSGITRVLEREYTPLIGSSNYSSSRELQILHSFEEHMVDGLIVSTTGFPETQQFLQQLLDRGTPIVQLECYLPDLKTSIVEADNEQLTELCTSHLLEMGYRRIAFLRSPHVNSCTINRAKGYENVMKRAGLTPKFFPAEPYEDRGNVFAFNEDQAYRALQQMTPPFGIVTNSFASVLRMLPQFSLRCPEDVGIVGIDADSADYRNVYRIDPTQVVFSLQEQGMQTATELINQIESDGTRRTSHIKIPGRLVLGKSTAKVA